ncbi:hypothetical protein NG791_15745 [Laspinema sp. D1]|uniref:hypothetical protein n=1 Tax=Laspinema palackyanum TaxID=3231601 RepID=UPI003489C740|nr:hypothetical protein [Laspinema sp. D2b]
MTVWGRDFFEAIASKSRYSGSYSDIPTLIDTAPDLENVKFKGMARFTPKNRLIAK